MSLKRKQFACGVVCLFTDQTESIKASEQLAATVAEEQHQFALVFFSKASYSPQEIVSLMALANPDLAYAACSTAGEITPHGLTEGELVILLFPGDQFRISACQIARRNEPGMEDVISRISALRGDFPQNTPKSSQTFAICLMDGMSHMEEAITAALHWALEDIPLLGGSAGDDMNFSETSLILNGEIIDGRAILLLFNTALPFHIFKTENFIPRPEKLVVTASDPDRRIVHELNGAPAAQVYADVIGANPNSLTPQSFASHPLVVRVGGEYYCRSIQKVNDDNSLTFFCAIDDGVVLTVAEPTGMARTTRDTMEEISSNMGNIDFILGFDCVLRQIDARNRQITQKISEIYRDHQVVGFNTYGEQYRSMHLNQTLTGVAFGRATVSMQADISDDH